MSRIYLHRSGASMLAIAAAFGGAALVASPAAAQTKSGPVQSDGSLAVVTVTAQRRVENVQKVAIAATVLSSKMLAEQGIISVQDLQKTVPGLSIQPGVTSETFINIRGVGLQQTNPASSNGVAFYVDGQYVPSLIPTVDSFYDLASVEVLRGPQGTLVGSNSDGGAMFLNSAQPSLERTEGYIQQTFGDYADLRTEGTVNTPLSDVVAARVAFVRETRNSFTTNVGNPNAPSQETPDQPGNINFDSVRAQLLYKPSTNFDTTLRFETWQSRTDGYALKPDMSAIPTSNPGYDPYAASIAGDPFKIDYDTPTYWNISGERGSDITNWNFSDFAKLRSVTSLQYGYEQDQDDIDASSSAGQFVEDRRTDFRTISQELNLISTQGTPLQWVAGLYYLNQRDPLALNFSDPAPFPSVALDLVSKHVNYGVFGSATYKFTPQWSVTVGLRESHDSLPFIEEICTGFPEPCGNYHASDNEFNYSAKLNWQVTPQTLAYFSASTGYKAGGINLQIPDIGFTPAPFQPETNTVYELGLKSSVLDNHVRFDTDVFDSDYQHYQLQEFTGGLPNTQGPGNATIYGAEGQILGRFGNLTANMSMAYLHGTVSGEFPYELSSGNAVNITSGTVVPFAPSTTFSIGAQYDIDLPGGTLTPRVQYQYQASQFTDIEHVAVPGPDQAIPAHGTVDFHLNYQSLRNWSIEAYVLNLANTVYIADVQQNPQPAAPWIAYGAPRQFGVKMGYKF